MSHIMLRPAEAGDRPFLFDMLYEAVNWAGVERIDRERIRSTPQIVHYITDWPRPGEFGTVAFVDPGYRVGACWVRYLPLSDPGYGYVADDVPELTVAVSSLYRRQGVGRRLLESVIAEARARGVTRLSLSAEDLNQVTRLYEQVGFRAVDRNGDSTVMVVDLAEPAS